MKKAPGIHSRIYEKLHSRVLLSVALIVLCSSGYAQKKERDSLKVYKKIKKFAYKHKLTTWAYKAVFVEPKPIEYPSAPASHEEKIVNPYLKYTGHTIKKINITVYDPFGYSVTDTIRREIIPVEKLGNHAHIKTRNWVINNKLLFKENDTINALQLSESERLLREAVYVNDVRIFITPVKNSDSVEVNVVVLDKWPVLVPTVVSDLFVQGRFINKNLFGLGQQFEQFVEFRKPNLMNYSGSYNVANIDNTYISANLAYWTNRDGTRVGLSFDRPFYSPLTKYAGGLALYHTQHFHNYRDTLDGKEKRLNLISYYYDAWIGKSFKLKSTKSFFSQSNNIIVGARYYTTTYLKRPEVAFDVARSNFNTSAYIGNIGYAVQQYYKDKFIYRFGANEDVPKGLIVQLLYGVVKEESQPLKYYTGFEVARAAHFKLGYLSATLAAGMFFNKFITNDITTNFRLNYFTDLFRIRRWYFREFLNYNILHGINKPASARITLRSDELYGFESGNLSGNTKMVLNFETVAYAPYNIIGFKVAPVLLVGLGMMSDAKDRLLQSNLYQAYSLGLMIRNENLLSSTFQFSFGVYPIAPATGGYALKYNPVASFTLRVRAFAVSRPEFISY